MKRKSVAFALMVVLLLSFAGPAFSSWGLKSKNFGPIVVQGHPWGESSRSIYTPTLYRPGYGGGIPEFFPAPGFINFVVQFYVRYVVKQQMEGQRFTHRYRNGD